MYHTRNVDRNSSVGIATRYGLYDLGIESRWGKIFRTCPYRPWGPPRLLYNGYRVSFPAIKRPGRALNHPPPSTAEVKERVQLYLPFPSGPSWLVLGRILPFYLLPFYFYCSVQLVWVKRKAVLCTTPWSVWGEWRHSSTHFEPLDWAVSITPRPLYIRY
jgi:hypothetical protein